MDDLLGLPDGKVNDDRLYRALDQVLPHKRAVEMHLKKRLGELFDLEYDLLLYDVTSTYFEGLAKRIRRRSGATVAITAQTASRSASLSW